MPSQNKRPVYVSQRIGKRYRWIEAGLAVSRADGTVDVWLDRMPVGGFNGHILVPRGATQPTVDDMPVSSPFDDQAFET